MSRVSEAHPFALEEAPGYLEVTALYRYDPTAPGRAGAAELPSGRLVEIVHVERRTPVSRRTRSCTEPCKLVYGGGVLPMAVMSAALEDAKKKVEQ